eukprot:1015205_1
MDEQRIRLRDPEYNNIEENNNGIIWLSFSEFVQYFTSVIVCYSDTQYKEARQTTDILYVLILIPMSTQRNKFVKFGASDEDVKTNDLSSGISWKNGDRLSEGTYFLVPYTSGIHWESDEKGSDDDVRYIGLTVHGTCTNGDFSLQPVDGFSGNDIDPVLLKYAFKYGEKKQWQDLERRHLQMGQLDIYAGKNTCQDKNLLFTMTPTEFTNVVNASGYYDFKLNQEKQFKINVGETVLFAVNVPADASK